MYILWILGAIERGPAVEKKIILNHSPDQTSIQRIQLKNQLEANGFVVQESLIQESSPKTYILLGTVGALALSLLAYFSFRQKKSESQKEAKVLSFKKEEEAQLEEKKKFKG